MGHAAGNAENAARLRPRYREEPRRGAPDHAEARLRARQPAEDQGLDAIAATQFLARTTKRPRGADPPRRTPALTSPCANRIRRGRTNLLKSLANVWRRLELSGMRRRELIALLGGAVVGWPLAVCAQHGGVPV